MCIGKFGVVKMVRQGMKNIGGMGGFNLLYANGNLPNNVEVY